MKHITTYSGEDFTPLCPNENQIKIEDIAHALSLMCRANGHFESFFSVAQHCINCMAEARARGFSKKMQLACLLHDASEAYISDITRPVKAELPEYCTIEKRLQALIYEKFLGEALTAEEHSVVKQIDDDMLVCEFNALMKKKVFSVAPLVKATLDFDTKEFKAIENRFIKLFKELTGDVGHNSCFSHKFISVGIDGCKGKWLVVALRNDGFDVKLFDTIGSICDYYDNADSVIIDMPIGLAESESDIRPDGILRKHLNGKSSSVFNTPCRQAVYANEDSASETNYTSMGKKLSRQSIGIIPKIREIDTFLQENEQWKNRLVESHPEYCFAILNKGNPIIENKQTTEGHKKRLDVLSNYYPQSYELVTHFKSAYPALSGKLDDVLDALVLAVVGAMGIEFGFTTLPETPMLDTKGLKMQIIGTVIN